MPRVVLIAIDGSEHSERALDFYLENIGRPDDDQVLLVHIFSPPHPPALSLRHPSPEPWDEWRAKVDKELERVKGLLLEFEHKCDEYNIPRKAVVHSGSPGEGVVHCANEHNASLIVIGSRGLNLLRRTFVGSVSDYVIHHSHIPVMVVPPEDHFNPAC